MQSCRFLFIGLLVWSLSIAQGEDDPPELPVHSVTKAHHSYVSAVVYSGDGRLAASSDMKGMVMLWDAKAGLKSKGEFRAATGQGVEKWVWCLALSANGKLLAAGSDDKTVWVWDTESGKLGRRVRGHRERVDQVFFLGDGKQGVSVEKYGPCLIWDTQGEREPRRLEIGGEVAALSPSGKLLCVSDGNETFLYDLPTGKKRSTLGKYCQSVAFSADSKTLTKGDNSFPKTVQLWDARTGKQIWASKGHDNEIDRVLFVPDGKRILSIDGVRLHVWDVQTGDEVGRFRIGGKTVTTCIAASPDGTLVLLGDREGSLTLHDFPK